MRLSGKAGWLTASLMAVALAGCATTSRHGGLDHSAARLDRNAQALAQDAQDFAVRAHEFRRTVESGADRADVKASFDELSRSYHALRDSVERSGSDTARRDMQPVTQAYLDIEDDMGGAGPRSRYSEADYDQGPR